MKRTLYGAALLVGAAAMLWPSPAAAKQKKEKAPKWKLVWKDDFKKDGFLDPAKWSKIPRGGSDWNNYMSSRDDLYEVKDGNLILRGIVNDRPDRDTARYITGGVWTKDKFSVMEGTRSGPNWARRGDRGPLSGCFRRTINTGVTRRTARSTSWNT